MGFGMGMPFKIVSTVSISVSAGRGKPVNYPVLTRERPLHSGEKIPIKGSITNDAEAKGGWMSAKGEIRVIGDKKLGIRLRPSFGEAVVHGITESEVGGLVEKVREAKEYSKWGEERILEASVPGSVIDLRDQYSSPELPEVFTLLDRMRIGPMTEKAMRNLNGTKFVERKTELIYEP